MSRRIFFDGLNLALEHGTGIATYTRMLAGLVHGMGHEVGLVYSAPRAPAKDPLLREIDLADPREARRISKTRRRWNEAADQLRCALGLRPAAVDLTGAVVAGGFCTDLPVHDHLFVARNLFASASRHFAWSGGFVRLDFSARPDILHCTYPLPLRAKAACNIYTVHDLVPLRLPYTTLDNKRQIYRLLRRLAADADHIVTVSENSRRDIIELLGVDERRITNTYEAVEFPSEYIERSDDLVAAQLESLFRLRARQYLLFYGAIEPKKNVRNLVEAYLLSTVAVPLVIVGGGGWANQAETKMLNDIEEQERSLSPDKRRLRRLDYVSRSVLATLIKGARAVVFPSLYEGFGLPVLEAMTLGTPVVTSRASSLPEIAGDAGLYVNPYDTGDIARAIQTIVADDGLAAELARRGRKQAELFSVERYRERVADLYRRLG